jgi:hypothetical protein
MKPLSRRSVIAGSAAAVTALPATAALKLPKSSADDKLLAEIKLHWARLDAVNAPHGWSDEKIDRHVRRAERKGRLPPQSP